MHEYYQFEENHTRRFCIVFRKPVFPKTQYVRRKGMIFLQKSMDFDDQIMDNTCMIIANVIHDDHQSPWILENSLIASIASIPISNLELEMTRLEFRNVWNVDWSL